MKRQRRNSAQRRGTILVLTAFLMVVLVGLLAFSVDLGYIVLVRTQLQAAVDSAALAAAQTMGSQNGNAVTTAQQFAAYHSAGGKSVTLTGSDVQYGNWDSTTKVFTASGSVGNALKITARRDNTTGGNNFFFGRIFGKNTFTTQVSAIAMGNPRDICFVVDLSGSMNDDTEICWSLNALSGEGYGTVANQMQQQLFTDFGYGTAPGTLKWIGEVSGTGIATNNDAYANLTKTGGYLTGSSIASTYKILSGDSEATRKTKAYKWIIDKQIAVVMPLAKPTPSSSTTYAYWEKYLDYIIESKSISGRGTLPPSQDTDRITGLNNPNDTSFPSASTTTINSFRNKIGYQTYVQFMLDNGRNTRPDGTNYVPLSVSSPYCPYHNESTPGGTFSFPPSEQPTHAARRSLIAAIKEVKNHNLTVSDPNQRDWVSIVAFDTVAGTVLKKSLTSDYDAAMAVCTTLQAVGDDQSSTATETGLIGAYNHIKPTTQGGLGRQNTQKVVVLLTDGMPNLYSSSTSAINNYISGHSNTNFYSSSGNYPANGALMQCLTMQLLNWKVFPVGLGLGTDYSFMDRTARMGSTANNLGQSPRTSGDPSAYETELTTIFSTIITNPQVRLVQ